MITENKTIMQQMRDLMRHMGYAYKTEKYLLRLGKAVYCSVLFALN